MTSSNGNIFRVTGPLCGEFTGPGEFPAQWPVTRSFDVFFDLGLNKRLSKQPWGWWFETPPWSLWRQCNENRHQICNVFSHLSRPLSPQLNRSTENTFSDVIPYHRLNIIFCKIWGKILWYAQLCSNQISTYSHKHEILSYQQPGHLFSMATLGKICWSY